MEWNFCTKYVMISTVGRLTVMKKKIKAIFFDVDGTIYWHDIHDILASTKDSMQRLHDAGYKIGVATSRCRPEFDNTPSFLREFPFDGLIFDGGAMIIEHDHIQYQHGIEPEDMHKLISYAKEHDIGVRYATADGNYFIREEDAQMQDGFFRLYLNVPIPKPYENEICNNFLLYANEEQRKEILPQLHDVNISDHGSLVEITAKGTNKATAIQKLVSSWGFSMDEVLCFGDGYNDLEMIQQAGIGVAMGNGQDVLKQCADYVCDPIDQDGIANMIQELGLL